MRLFKKKKENYPNDIILNYTNKIDYEPRSFSAWDYEKMQSEIEEDDQILEQKIAEFHTKEETIINCVKLFNQAKTGDYSNEERYDLIVESLTALVENDVKISYWVSPYEFKNALEYFEDVAANSSNSHESSRLVQEIATARDALSDKKKLKSFLCNTSPEIIAKVYIDRTYGD